MRTAASAKANNLDWDHKPVTEQLRSLVGYKTVTSGISAILGKGLVPPGRCPTASPPRTLKIFCMRRIS